MLIIYVNYYTCIIHVLYVFSKTKQEIPLMGGGSHNPLFSIPHFVSAYDYIIYNHKTMK
jgi:hypothetical protein